MNQPLVKSALHVQTGITWHECSNKVRYNGTVYSTVPIYKDLVQGVYSTAATSQTLSILVYSGDDDSVCGTIGTQNWIWKMGFTVDTNVLWKPYMYKGQTAGNY